MPAIASKASALNGKGVVFCYEGAPDKWYYREKVPGERRYRYKLIDGASDETSALALCFNTFEQLNATPAPVKRTVKRERIDDAISAYLSSERKKVDAGELAESTFERKDFTLRKHLNDYVKAEGIEFVDEIQEGFLDNYSYYRRQVAKNTRKKELQNIGTFISHHLIRLKLLSPEVAMSKTLVPKIQIRQAELDANPAINESDWKKINAYIRFKWIPEGKATNIEKVIHWRMLFWTFTVVMKNTGARPNELRKLRWKDIELENIGRWSESKQEQEDRIIAYLTLTDDKTGSQREVPANVGDALLRWLKYRNSYLLQNCPMWDELVAKHNDAYVFGNPHNEHRPYSHHQFLNGWRKVMLGVGNDLKGHKFSERNYTIYSMRSTFIEDKLLEGMDIYLLARLCGHSVTVLMRHYERLDLRKRAEEITAIDYGKRKKLSAMIDTISYQG